MTVLNFGIRLIPLCARPSLTRRSFQGHRRIGHATSKSMTCDFACHGATWSFTEFHSGFIEPRRPIEFVRLASPIPERRSSVLASKFASAIATVPVVGEARRSAVTALEQALGEWHQHRSHSTGSSVKWTVLTRSYVLIVRLRTPSQRDGF